jgi:DNA-binding NtrC family response regulator
VVQFQLPPLRERGEDVLVLANHFLRSFRMTMNKNVAGISPDARHKLSGHRWPGNVRELRNAIERALILETTRELQSSSLPAFQVEARLQKAVPVQAMPGESLDAALMRVERELISNALEQNGFSLTRTAEALKLTRHSLRYRMQRLDMKTSDTVAGEE